MLKLNVTKRCHAKNPKKCVRNDLVVITSLKLGYNEQILSRIGHFNNPSYNKHKWPVPSCSLLPSLTVVTFGFYKV
jgi:hypothetical protein